ncbi:MAG: HAMP domain-containing histidine kinase [Deltaproteobacteria bacterium]|nr:HAMP domain-containing histidine kinase [Deltaproteobacteria bacterium]
MAPELEELFRALPDPAVLVDGESVVAVSCALLALVGADEEASVDLGTLIEEDLSWIVERLPQVHASGEVLRIHIQAGGRSVPIDMRVGRMARGTWVLVGRDATDAERVGSLIGRLASMYARGREPETLAGLFALGRPLFDAMGWTVALFRVEGEVAVLEDSWLAQRLREHPSGYGKAIENQLAAEALPRRMPLEAVPFIQLAAREGHGSTIEDFPPLVEKLTSLLEFDVPTLQRSLLVEVGLARGATAPVFVDDRVSHVVAIAAGAIDERESAGLQLFASMLSTVLRANQLGDEMARQQRHAALGQMSRQLAHEVRNPLAVILHASHQARKNDGQASKAELLDMVDEEARRLERLMSDLVSFAGPLTLRLRNTPVVDLVRWSLEALTDRERDPRIDVEVDASLSVQADPMLFRQALTHVLANACSHASERVHVSAERDEDRVILRIENDGGPIPDGVAERVFEPFFSTRPTGTGLGLAVVRRLIEDQGGQVQLERSTDMTVFLLELPAGGE